MDLVESPRRRKPRRRWSDAEKLRVVALSYEPGMSASEASRIHDVNTNMLFTWRREAKKGTLALSLAPREPAFAVIDVVDPKPPEVFGDGRMEIELSGATVRVGPDVNQAALVRVIAALRSVR